MKTNKRIYFLSIIGIALIAFTAGIYISISAQTMAHGMFNQKNQNVDKKNMTRDEFIDMHSQMYDYIKKLEEENQIKLNIAKDDFLKMSDEIFNVMNKYGFNPGQMMSNGHCAMMHRDNHNYRIMDGDEGEMGHMMSN